MLRRHYQRRELRGVRGIGFRSQHREHGEPEHGVVSHGGAVGYSEIDVVLVDQPERGVIGIGERRRSPLLPRVANGDSHATGVTLRHIRSHRTNC